MDPLFSRTDTSTQESNGIVRDFGDYSLRFPCDPHMLIPMRRGMGFLIWSNLILTAAFFFMGAVVVFALGRSEKFAEFAKNLTEERIEQLQALAPQELYLELEDELPLEEAVQPIGAAMLVLLAGTVLNVVGIIWFAKVPQNIFPGAWSSGFVWYGALVLGSIIPFLLPLLLLLAWQKWLQCLLRLSLFLGEPEAVKYLRMVHRAVFYVILLFLAVTLVPWLLEEPSSRMTIISGIQWLLFACLIFAVFTYIRLLGALRTCIARMNALWVDGSSEFLER